MTELDSRWPKRMQDDWGRLWNMAEKFLNHHHQDVVEQSQLRITSSSRAQPGWSDVELAWENVDLSLGDGIKQADRLRLFIETLPPGDPVEPDGLALGAVHLAGGARGAKTATEGYADGFLTRSNV